MSASFQAICWPLGFSWRRENQQRAQFRLYKQHRCRNCTAIYPTEYKVCLGFLWLNQLLPEALGTWRKHLYRTLFSFFWPTVVFNAFLWKTFRLKTARFACSKDSLRDNPSWKAVSLTASLLVFGSCESCELLHLWGVLTFFLVLGVSWGIGDWCSAEWGSLPG